MEVPRARLHRALDMASSPSIGPRKQLKEDWGDINPPNKGIGRGSGGASQITERARSSKGKDMVQAHAGMPSDVSNTETKSLLARREHPFLSKGHEHNKSATGLVEKVLKSLHLQTHHRLSSQGQLKGTKTLPLCIKTSKLLVVYGAQTQKPCYQMT